MTKYESLMAQFKEDPEAFRKAQAEEQMHFFSKTVMRLQKLQHHMSQQTLVDWFGTQLGEHLWEKFVVGHRRNLLSFLSKLTDEYRYCILHMVKTDSSYS